MTEIQEICEFCGKEADPSFHYQQWDPICLDCLQNLRDEVEASGETWSDM